MNILNSRKITSLQDVSKCEFEKNKNVRREERNKNDFLKNEENLQN